MQYAKNKFNKIEERCKSINFLTSELLGSESFFFDDINTPLSFNHAELTFSQLISYIYVLLYEASGKNYEFIKRRIGTQKMSSEESNYDLQRIIHSFRTFYQHNLLYSKRDQEIKNVIADWFFLVINKESAVTEEDWTRCAHALLDETNKLLDEINICIKEIGLNEHRGIILQEWLKMSKMNFSPYDFEKVLIEVLANFDMENYFDSAIITKKQFPSWKKELDLAPINFDFNTFAYKIIERYLLSKDLCPLDSKDIIDIGVENTKVFQLLKKAKEIFYESPCGKAELLEKLKLFI